MFARYAALLSFAATALALSSGDLTVKLSAASSSVASVDDILLTTVVSNPTAEDIKVIKFNTVLDELPTKSFTVTKGEYEVAFSGLDVAPAFGNDAAYIVIPAGGSIAVNHTVAASFDFEAAGAGTFTFQTITGLQVAEGDEIVHFDLDAASVDVEVTDDVAQRFVFGEPEVSLRTSTPTCNNASRRQYLADSLREARAVAGGAAANVRQEPNSGRFNEYFSNASRDEIWWNFDRVAGDLPSSGNRGLHCIDRPNGACSNPGIAAYVLLVTSGGNIIGSEAYFCEWFFTSTRPLNSVCGGTDFPFTRSSVMLHELTHAVFASRDTVYGCPGSRGLSAAAKRLNADNYTCFGMHVWKAFNC